MGEFMKSGDAKPARPVSGRLPVPKEPKRPPGHSGDGADSVLPHLRAWERSRAKARAARGRDGPGN
jgi:hypothetical protein